MTARTLGTAGSTASAATGDYTLLNATMLAPVEEGDELVIKAGQSSGSTLSIVLGSVCVAWLGVAPA